jgi:hypothetical protein
MRIGEALMRRMTVYRVTIFRCAQGPWRINRRQACMDAIALGLGDYDANGQFYLTVPADIQHMDVWDTAAAA